MKNDHEVLTVGVFKEVLKEFGASIEARIDRKVEDKIDGLRTEMVRGFDEVRQEFKAVRSEIARGFDKVRDDIIDVIDQNIQPQLTSHAHRIARLERKMA